MNLPNPVIRSHYCKGLLKKYVRDRVLLRTEPVSTSPSRLSDLPGFFEALRQDLCSSDCRYSAALRR
jgi:hypothetical protein